MKSVVVSGCCASCMHALSVIVCQVVISFTDMLLYYMVVGRSFVIPLKTLYAHVSSHRDPSSTTYRLFVLFHDTRIFFPVLFFLHKSINQPDRIAGDASTTLRCT